MMQDLPPGPSDSEPAPFWNRKRITVYTLIAILGVILVVVVVFALTAPSFHMSEDYLRNVVPNL